MADKPSPPETILFIFIDGIGFGGKDGSVNPFARFKTPFFGCLGGENNFTPPGKIIETDTSMGLRTMTPQSGTGQVALFTGTNTVEITGRHVAGFPPFSLRPVIKDRSILKQFIERNKTATVVNAYSEKYLERLKLPRSERLMSASTLMQSGAGVPYRTMEQLRSGEALYMDITNWILIERGVKIDPIDPHIAGRRLVQIARNHNLIVYEYFLTDQCGHTGDFNKAQKIIYDLNALLEGIWEELDPDNELVLISSDHGNFENLEEAGHTMNFVPTITYGKGVEYLETKVSKIESITPALLSLF